MKRILLALLLALPIQAYARPDSVRIVVPFAAGGTTDLTARILADAMSAESGSSVVVENRPGGNGVIAVDHILRQPADGRTLYMAANSLMTQRYYAPEIRDLERDLKIVSIIADSPMVMLVTNQLPASNVREFVALAMSQPDSLNYAMAGQVSVMRMATELFTRSARISMTAVPYSGGAPAVPDLMAGRVAMMFDSVAVGMRHARAGTARAFAVTSSERSRQAPDVPTFRELGYDVVFNTWQAVFVSSSTPDDVKYWLNASIRRALNNPTTVQRIMDLGMESVMATRLDQSTRMYDAERTRWREILGDRR